MSKDKNITAQEEGEKKRTSENNYSSSYTCVLEIGKERCLIKDCISRTQHSSVSVPKNVNNETPNRGLEL